jgi:predicted nucleotidyltransferase
MSIDDPLRELVGSLSKALHGDLLAVVLYGSAARGEYHERHSDLNVLCILRQVGARELELVAAPLRAWVRKGQPAPLFLSEEEVRGACDVFPIEFLDLRDGYRLLYGEDLVASIQVNTANHRRQLEHELRSRVLRLRRRFLETHHDNKVVCRLMLDSLSTFAALFRHALIAAGFEAPLQKAEIFRAAAERFGIGPAPFDALLEVRTGARKLDPAEVRGWFNAYLDGVTRLARRVDEIARDS